MPAQNQGKNPWPTGRRAAIGTAAMMMRLRLSFLFAVLAVSSPLVRGDGPPSPCPNLPADGTLPQALISEEGYQWVRVRHTPELTQSVGVTKWHASRDNLLGTDVYGNRATDDQIEPWSVAWNEDLGVIDKFLFASGDCAMWGIMSVDQLIDGTGAAKQSAGTQCLFSDSGLPLIWESSSINAATSSPLQLNRPVSQCGVSTEYDPWLSVEPHSTPSSIVYGEADFSSWTHTHTNQIKQYKGFDVYVRKPWAPAPPPPPTTANPLIPFYGYGSIVPTPNPPTAGETTAIDVTVRNGGDGDAEGVEVMLSLNTWAVSFGGWQEIGTQLIPALPAGGEEVLSFSNVFEDEGHTCLQAKILGVDAGGDQNPSDNMGQINMMVQHCDPDNCDFNVPFTNGGEELIVVTNIVVACPDEMPSHPEKLVQCPGAQADYLDPDSDGDGLAIEAGGEKEVPIKVMKQMDQSTPLLVVVQGTGPDGEVNHVVVKLVPATVEEMLNGLTLCCLTSVKHRVLLGSVLADALDAYEAGRCKDALKLLRFFLQKAKILECDLSAEEKRCLLEVKRKVADIARMILKKCVSSAAVAAGKTAAEAAAAANRAAAEGAYFTVAGLLEAAVLTYQSEVQDHNSTRSQKR